MAVSKPPKPSPAGEAARPVVDALPAERPPVVEDKQPSVAGYLSLLLWCVGFLFLWLFVLTELLAVLLFRR